MKRPLPHAAFAIACLALFGAGFASAQDPAVVNAKSVQVRLENDRVRVLEAVLQPGEREQLHSHPSYVTYVLVGGTMRIHGADGSVRESTVQTGDVLYRDPVAHWAENIGDTSVRFLLVELKSPAP
jgi:quercetin dioxygenase-like cupin family protein